MAKQQNQQTPKYIAVNFVGTFIRVSNLERSVEEVKKEIDKAATLAKTLAENSIPCPKNRTK